MSLNPLNELKRRLDDSTVPLPKRLCLAKNVVQSHFFPAAPKERIVAEWLAFITENNQLRGGQLMKVLNWLNYVDDLTGELKSKLIQIVADYIKRNPVKGNEIQHILNFVENTNIAVHLQNHTDDYLLTVMTVLKHLHSNGSLINVNLCKRLLSNLVTYYKECKRKFEFIIKILEGENLEIIFAYLDTEVHDTVLEMCSIILFPLTKKAFFLNYLQTLVKKDKFNQLANESGDKMQSVIKIMNAIFKFPDDTVTKDEKFLKNFIQVFVGCFKTETSIVYYFYVLVCNSLNMVQSYINPKTAIPLIIFDENDDKIKRNLFLNMLTTLVENDVETSVKFMNFIQATMMGQIKLEGKPDKTTMYIIKTALKLDPVIVEEKINEIFPPIMASKKNANVLPSYVEMLNYLMETLFKLSRGNLFVHQIVPHLKLHLETGNTEQFELRQQASGTDSEKIKNKIITGNDVFPTECAEMYGKLSSELMFRQNSELLVSLQKDFKEHCLVMLEDGFVSPSIIILAEVFAAILSNYWRHNKMADHTVPRHVAEGFWTAYKNFEVVCLKKFGECILKLNYNPPLLLSFLKLCESFSQLKLLNIKYGNTKVDLPKINDTLEVYDLSYLLPCLKSEQWMSISSMVEELDAILTLDNLILLNTTAIDLTKEDNKDILTPKKTHLIKQYSKYAESLDNRNCFTKSLFAHLDRKQNKMLAKCLVKRWLDIGDVGLLKMDSIENNKAIVDALVLKVLENILKCCQNGENLMEALSETDFNVASFSNSLNLKEYFDKIELKENHEDKIAICLGILRQLQIYYLAENVQLTVVFVILLLKKCCQQKKLKKNIDHLLLSVFELSPKCPDLYKIFPVQIMFSTDDSFLIDLLHLKIKTSDKMMIVKTLMELAVKKVKAHSEIVKQIVEILLKGQTEIYQTTKMDYFSQPVFQLSCAILPLIAKEKKAITTSAYRSILADLQERLHNTMLEAFKNTDFTQLSSASVEEGNTEASENALATLNAVEAFTLTLSKYCETSEVAEIKKLDCLWSGLEFFLRNAINTLSSSQSRPQHVNASINLLNVTLRHIKKLESHEIFQKRDKLLCEIWRSVIECLKTMRMRDNEKRNQRCLEEMAVALKYTCELVSVECFTSDFVEELNGLMSLKDLTSKDEALKNTAIASHKTAKYLWTQCLISNIVGQKCVAMSRCTYRNIKSLRTWMQQRCESQNGGHDKMADRNDQVERKQFNVVTMDDGVCEVLKIDLEIISQVIMSAKKISLDYKFLDSVFILLHQTLYVLSHNSNNTRFNISWQSILKLYEGTLTVLNCLLMSREEILEDRWPNYMQCYKLLISSLCEKSTSEAQLEKLIEEKLAEVAHSVEKLTQSISKRKEHISRLAAYTVADICSCLELATPTRLIRQHLENSVALLIQASDSSFSMAFLKRALAGAPGQMTMTNMYSMYKKYHKYVGNS